MRRSILRTILFATVGIGISVDYAAATPTRACPDDRPCFGQAFVDRDGLYFDWDDFGGNRYTHYNVRWSRAGIEERQFETRNEFFTIRNPHRQTVYTLKVQGCRRPVIGASTCTPWEARRFRTP